MTSPTPSEERGMLVERLKVRAPWLSQTDQRLLNEAAAEITRLRAEVAPFAALAKRMLDKEIPRHIQDDEGTPVLGSGVAYEDPDAVVVTVGDLRRAARMPAEGRAALEQEGG